MRRAALLLLAASLLAGCGGDTLSLDPVARAADKTDDVASARFTLTAEVRGAAKGVVRFSGPGAFADHGEAMRMRVTLEPTADRPRHVAEMVVVDGTYYVRSGLFGALLPHGKVWFRFTDGDAGFVSGLGQNDPAKVIAFLRATGDVEAVGTERIRGVETTHYKAEVEVDKVMDRASPEQRDRVRGLTDAIRAAGIEKIPLDVWVDDDDLVRRMKLDWSFSNPNNASDPASVELTMDLFDFGADVTVKAPPAHQVATG